MVDVPFFWRTEKRPSLFLNYIWQKQDSFKIGTELLESFSEVNPEHKHIHWDRIWRQLYFMPRSGHLTV